MNRALRGIVGLIIALLWCSSPGAGACQICLPFPKVSVADHLREADIVALARENPEKPFSLKAVEVIKGELENPEIDLFLDSQSRRMLKVRQGVKLLCVYRSRGEEAGWRRVGTSDEVFGPVILEILEKQDRWKETPEERLEFFGNMLGSEDPQVRTLSHLEVAGAPYNEIRKLGDALPPSELRAFLDNVRYIEWHALYILLLAQSDDEGDRERIREAVKSAEKYGLTTQLAAWATAFVEIDEIAAIDFIEQRILSDPNRKAEEIKAVIAALSVHATNGHTHLRDRIAQSYRAALENYPTMAPSLVGDLKKWERWELADSVRAALSDPAVAADFASVQPLRAFLLAAEAGRQSGDAKGGGSGSGKLLPLLIVALIGLPLFLAFLAKGRTRE